MQELEEFPILKSNFKKLGNDMKHCVNIHACENIIWIKSNNIIEFLQNSKEKGITHLVIDNKEKRRAVFVNDIFENEQNFSYLIKIYDSKEEQLSYQVKIFKINYDKFDCIVKEICN